MCALKIIHKNQGAIARQVFDHETALLKTLAHPNILRLVATFETSDEFVVATQFLQGGEMFDRLQKLHHYDEKAASKTAKKMLQALHYCHKHDVVHRDQKPESTTDFMLCFLPDVCSVIHVQRRAIPFVHVQITCTRRQLTTRSSY